MRTCGSSRCPRAPTAALRQVLSRGLERRHGGASDSLKTLAFLVMSAPPGPFFSSFALGNRFQSVGSRRKAMSTALKLVESTPAPAGRVLFVDDEPTVCRSFSRAVERLGYRVDTAASAAHAIALVESRKYEVVACDYQMPDLDGLELIEHLRAKHAGLTYVLVTGASDLRLPDSQSPAGDIAAVIKKPWDQQHLSEVLSFAMTLQEGRQEASALVRSATCVDDPTAVLLVEDAPADVYLTCELLDDGEVGRFDVTVASSLSAAFDELGREHFDVILADLSLPDARGIDVVLRLRTATDVPVVVLSGSTDEDLATHAVRRGAQDYLVKGEVSADRLRRVIRYSRERKRSMRRLTGMAYLDELTGLPNRRLFFDRLSHALASAKRQGHRVALLYADLDGFKAINDTFGHDAGDRVLQLAASRFSSCLRDCDTVARMGGDEFALVLTDCGTDDDVRGAMDRIREAMQEATPESPTGLGLSLGFAVYPDDASGTEELLSAADQGMYRVKKARRRGAVQSGPVARWSLGAHDSD